MKKRTLILASCSISFLLLGFGMLLFISILKDASRVSNLFYDALPLIIDNKTEENWLLIFLPYAEAKEEFIGQKIILPSLINDHLHVKRTRQYLIVPKQSQKNPKEITIEIYWGNKIDTQKFSIIVLGWKLKGELNFAKENVLDYSRKCPPDKVFLLENDNYLGPRHKDYKEFAKLILE